MLKIDDLIGIPYKVNGRDSSGLDCYGLAIEIEKRLGKNLRDIVYYSEFDKELASKNIPSLNVKATDYIKEGSLLEMYKDGELHIGVALDSKLMIHATRNQGVRISPIGFYHIKGIFEVWEN